MNRVIGPGGGPRPAAPWGWVVALLIASAGTARAAPDATSSPAPRAATAGRSLADIHIEGEVAVPQVLFITARDQRRFMEFQHRRYLRTSQEIGEQTVLPSRIAVIGSLPADVRKETQR